MTNEQIRAELDAIAAGAGGRLRVDDIIAAARPKTAVLHGQFDWDKARCVERDLRNQARALVERVRMIPGRHERLVTRVPLYVRDPDAGPTEQGYRSVAETRKDPVEAQRALEIEFDRAKSAMTRACAVAEGLGLAEDISALLVQLEVIAAKAQAMPTEKTDDDQPVV